MIQRKAVIGAAAFFLAAALFVGYFALAAEIGGKDNPLVTLDYLQSLNPQIEANIDAIVAEKTRDALKELDDKLAQAYERLDGMTVGGGGGANAAELINNEAFMNAVMAEIASMIGGIGGEEGIIPGVSVKVEVDPGKSVILPMGSSIMLRLGTGTVIASNSPGIIDASDPGVLDNGQNLAVNHIYTVTMEAGREIKCTGTTKMTVFIWGPYTKT